MKRFESYTLTAVAPELHAGGSGPEVFDAPEAIAINMARMQHLDSLGLPLAGRSVLDVGCGVGHLARFFLERRCRVVCVDGRQENIEELKRRYSGVPAHVLRVDVDPLRRLGRFEVVFCYGLLSHLENPVAGIRNLASACDDLLLLETVISDHELPLVRLVDEPPATTNQALDGLGCRPTPSFVAMVLTRAGFKYVYAPIEPPRHPDFEFSWDNNCDFARNNRLLRCILIASRTELNNSRLKPLLAALAGHKAPTYFLPTATTAPRRVWLDVGAHLGEKTFAEAERDPNLRVYAFEPNLRVATERMGQLPNFVMLPLAISVNDGSADFHVTAFDGSSSLLAFVPEGLDRWIGKEGLKVERTIAVPTMRLDTFMDQSGIERVEFLKIDAQGADLAVVRSCGDRLRDIERIELEVQITPEPLYAGAATRDEVIRYLENAGFELESSQAQSYGQEENLSFVRFGNHDPAELIAESRELSFLRPLRPYPGWHFGNDWNNPDPLFRRRRQIWSYCHRQNLQLPLEFDWHRALTLTLYLGNDISRALFIGGAIDPNEFAFLERFLQPGMVIVDAGANEGLYTLFAASRVGSEGKVLAFEPSAREISRLKSNIERNSLDNVHIFPVALGSAEGSATLSVAAEAHSGQSTLGEFIYPDVTLSTETPTSVRSLDALMAENNIARLDFLKLDVEGSETRLLYGAANTLRKFRPVLLLEVSDSALRKQSSSSDELLALVQSFGYLLYRFDDATGLPTLANPGETSVNMIAVPETDPLPGEWCANRSSGRYDEVNLAPSGTEFPLFTLATQTIFNNSQVSGSGPVFVTTTPQQWSFAVGFPVNEKTRQMIHPLSKIRVRLELEVEAGEVGIGVVNQELSAYVAPEVRYGASNETVYEIVLPYAPPDSILIVRNTAASGEISKAIVRSIAAFVVGD